MVMGGDGWETRSEASISSESFHDAPQMNGTADDQHGGRHVTDRHQADDHLADHPHSHPPQHPVPQANDTRYEAQQSNMTHAHLGESRYPPQNQGPVTEYQYGTARWNPPRTPYPQVHDPQPRLAMDEQRYGHAVGQPGAFPNPPAAMPTAHTHIPPEAGTGQRAAQARPGHGRDQHALPHGMTPTHVREVSHGHWSGNPTHTNPTHNTMHRLQASSQYPQSDDDFADGRMARSQYHTIPQERRRSRSRSPPKYNGKFDFLDFKVQFECIAEDNGWDYPTCGRKLSRCLTDSARSVLTSLDRHVRRDYTTLCAALESLHLTPGGEGLRRTELYQASRKEGQCPSAFARELQRLATKAYPQGDFPETALVQLFTKGLRSTACERHVNLQAPQTLDAAVRHACAFEAYSAEESSCKKPKPSTQAVAKIATANPLQAQITQLSEKVEQLAQQLTKPQEKRVVCYRCRETGHVANRCPNQVWPQQPPPGPWQRPTWVNNKTQWQGQGPAPRRAPVSAVTETNPAAFPYADPQPEMAGDANSTYPENFNSLNA